MPMSHDLELVQEGDLVWLVMNRPARRNAVTKAMWRALPDRLDEALGLPGKVLILRGAGGHFAAGADISEFEEVYADRESAEAYFSEMAFAMRMLHQFEKPVIAMIEGACVGAGMGIALCADLRLAAADAKLGITPAKLGLTYSLEDTKRLTDAVGPSAAKDILFTGRIMDAEEAWSIGLVDAVFGAGDLEAAVRAKAQTIADNSQQTVRSAKRIIGRILGGQALDNPETSGWQSDAVEGEDFQEGRAAFMAKRPPVFPLG